MRYFCSRLCPRQEIRLKPQSGEGRGLRKLLTEEFDLALIEMNMPEISGPNICRALRKHDQTRIYGRHDHRNPAG